ncbi:hypothetical protein BV25DRAFT_1529335 [Artomyces pyxidatus]|uniref:Uncharacterized protein n=1 Tax=Artomyces pyxidatus TaxID=48021 RepID=A0ACB8TDF1_9AGAM|nr:hypothetical protein BV25DRAFT_1529335 [Artomyces pyxidatus]
MAHMARLSVSGMRRLSVCNDPPHAVTVADYHPRRVARALARGDAAVVHGASVEGAQTFLPCIETTIPLPEGPARTLADGRMLSVWLQENGVLFVDMREWRGEIINAWAHTI